MPEYFTRREPAAPIDYADYWKPKPDPDGVLKDDRTSPRAQQEYLDDVSAEVRFLRSLPAGRFLDLGCGPGWMFTELAPLGWSCVGTELCEEVTGNIADRLAYIVHPSALARIPDGYFDVVRSHHVIEHLEDPIADLQQVRRLLTPGGHLLLSTPDFGCPCALRFGKNFRMYHDPTHISLFKQEGLCRLLTDTGFDVDHIDYPFPERYATAETFTRWNETDRMSPPWPGNWMTIYVRTASQAGSADEETDRGCRRGGRLQGQQREGALQTVPTEEGSPV